MNLINKFKNSIDKTLFAKKVISAHSPINKNPDLKQMMNDEQSRYVTRKSASISYGLILVIMSPIWLAFSFGILEPRLAMTIAFASVSTINPIVSAMVR